MQNLVHSSSEDEQLAGDGQIIQTMPGCVLVLTNLPAVKANLLKAKESTADHDTTITQDIPEVIKIVILLKGKAVTSILKCYS